MQNTDISEFFLYFFFLIADGIEWGFDTLSSITILGVSLLHISFGFIVAGMILSVLFSVIRSRAYGFANSNMFYQEKRRK